MEKQNGVLKRNVFSLQNLKGLYSLFVCLTSWSVTWLVDRLVSWPAVLSVDWCVGSLHRF